MSGSASALPDIRLKGRVRMGSSLKIKILAVFFLLCVRSGLASELIAEAEFLYVGGEPVSAELWGDRIRGGYTDNLMVIAKDRDGKVITAYAPTINGGYNCLLEVVSVSGGEKHSQLLVSSAKGSWQSGTEYRLLDFSDKKNIRDLLAPEHNIGVVKKAVIDRGELSVTFFDGTETRGAIGEWSKEEDKTISLGGIDSVIVHDADGDGVNELLVHQRLRMGRKTLAEVGSVWKYDAEARDWDKRQYAVVIADHQANTTGINNGVDFSKGAVLPRHIVFPERECTYPVFAANNDAVLQNKVNGLLKKEAEPFFREFLSYNADMAFRVNRADENILSLQLISAARDFERHYINISMENGFKLSVGDVFDLRNPDLIPLLNLLGSNKKVQFKGDLPDTWFLEDDKIFFVQFVEGREETTGYTISNLFKYIKMKKLLEKS